MRTAWLPVGLVVLGAVGAPLACGHAFEATGSSSSSGGGGGSAVSAGGTGGVAASSSDTTSTSMPTSTSTSTGTGPQACTKASECPGVDTLCGWRACDKGTCSRFVAQNNGSSFSQIYGDCRNVRCDNGVPFNDVNDGDKYDDGNSCTNDVCKNGTPSNPFKMAGAQCSNNNVCDGKGACVACLGDGDCEGTTPKCVGNYCVALTCIDGLKLSPETDVDCGGGCAPCADTKECEQASDCLSGICSVVPGDAVKTCHHDCKDGVKNGQETGVDCGGSVCLAKCVTNGGCAAPDDCVSGVCKAGVCLHETCDDGVKNGNEAGVDCGGGCPKPCPGAG